MCNSYEGRDEISVLPSPCPEPPDFVLNSIQSLLRAHRSRFTAPCRGFTSQAIEALGWHPWRGGVRELENVVARAILVAESAEVDESDLYFGPSTDPGVIGATWNLRAATRNFERKHIYEALASFANNKVQAARALGIGLSSLYRKMDELGISISNAPHA